MVGAVREQWSAMFFVARRGARHRRRRRGSLARRYDVANVLPNWSGDALDLVIDYVTYVFIPAYAVFASDILMPPALAMLARGPRSPSAARSISPIAGCKTDDYHFRGFPALWNVAAFYLFLLQPAPLSRGAVCRGACGHDVPADPCPCIRCASGAGAYSRWR